MRKFNWFWNRKNIIKVLILLIGSASNSYLAIFWIALCKEIELILKSNKLVFIKGFNFINRVRFKILFFGGHFFWIALYKEISLISRSGKIVFIIKGLILLIGFPNNKYQPNTKNYLRCLLIGGNV